MLGASKGLPPVLAFLFKLAWSSRVRLPLLIAAAFMITNVHMRLEININFEMDEQIVVQAEEVVDVSSNEEEEHEEEEEEEDCSASQIDYFSEELGSFGSELNNSLTTTE